MISSSRTGVPLRWWLPAAPAGQCWSPGSRQPPRPAAQRRAAAGPVPQPGDLRAPGTASEM